MFYTGYFAKLKQYKEAGLVPISIAGKAPSWYNGLEYKALAPKWSFFNEWKNGDRYKGDNNYYIQHFNDEVLANLNVDDVYNKLNLLAAYHDFILLCYEKPNDFCHRHLVADWFRLNGIACKEFNFDNNHQNNFYNVLINKYNIAEFDNEEEAKYIAYTVNQCISFWNENQKKKFKEKYPDSLYYGQDDFTYRAGVKEDECYDSDCCSFKLQHIQNIPNELAVQIDNIIDEHIEKNRKTVFRYWASKRM